MQKEELRKEHRPGGGARVMTQLDFTVVIRGSVRHVSLGVLCRDRGSFITDQITVGVV